MMKAKNILKGIVTSIFLILVFSGCEGYNVDVIDDLLVDRAFSPIGVTARVRNQTNVELNWTVREGIDHYVVEFSADDETFTTIYKTVNVSPAELPVTVALEGETVYSIRIKAVSATGADDSKWVTGQVTTLTEQIFTSIVDGDILSKEATLRWIPNSAVTQINLIPGNISHVITAQEKIDGIAKITGLSAETAYTATLLNGTKKRGVLTFTTGVDIGNATLVKPTDDLLQKIADAASGDVLVLEPGDYTAQKGIITLSKSITIRGLRSFDKPLLKNGFLVNSGTANVSLIDLDLQGEGATVDSYNDVVKYNEAGTYTSLLISGCNIRNFRKSLIYGDVASSTVNSIIVENNTITDIWCNGSDFIDFRKTNVLNLTVKTSTFNNCASNASTGARDFFRIDAAGATGTGLTTNVVLESCTLHNVSNIASRRIFYVRFANHTLLSKNNIFSNTLALYANQSTTNNPTFTNNNYSNAANLYTVASSPIRYDATGLQLDPGFTNAATGDFTISNQTLKDNLLGDPRWIK